MVPVGQFCILEIVNIPGKLTNMCAESEIPGGLTGGGAWAVWS